MKVLIVNNYLQSSIGGVENYLQSLVSYSEGNSPEITFRWFGVENKKTKIYQKFYNAATTKAIIAEIDTFKPDLIHCFSIGATVTPHFMRYAKEQSIPIIYSFHDYYYICPKGFMLNNQENELYKKHRILDCVLHHRPKINVFYDGLLNLKQSYHKSIIKKHIDYYLAPSEQLTEIIACEFNKPGELLANPVVFSNPNLNTQNSDYLLFVGRLIEEKGVLTLLKAFQQVLKNHPNEQLKIVGSGNFQDELEQYVSIHKIKNVAFLGSKNRDELMLLYASAKFTIVPSEILESYGNVVLESFAFDKTVISSNLIGFQKEITETNSGLIFPYGNVQKLAEAIEKLLTNTELRKELEQNGMRYVKNLSIENHLQHLQMIYNKVLKREL
ncbi:glycosyltransferase family 4 protein [Flavobacterium antarcticum]|uniref:glycosyltransferase family 4 protein n=1 Tax=Flavobacterium antarcticum TaxID=271155 RepID=UPI0003B56DD7|nr:glycosyltransferase family 4 protein [Flavobacterium antarcticum]